MNRIPIEVTAFLSCSIRSHDAPLVNKIESMLLKRGIAVKTVGRNVAIASVSPDEAIKRVMSECDCLIGLATKRFDAFEIGKSEAIGLPFPYLFSESSMAFQQNMPYLIIKTADVILSGVPARNTYLTILPTLSPEGKIRFKDSTVNSMIFDLKEKAKKFRSSTGLNKFLDIAGKFALAAGALVGTSEFLKRVNRPKCFGDFYYRYYDCKVCRDKLECKVEKAKHQNS